jgi:hypothetical protein
LGVDHGANTSTLENCIVTKPPEPMKEENGEGKDPNRAVALVKKKKLPV